MEKSKERIRLIILSLLVIAIFMTGSLRLMQFQVVNGATFREEANKLTVSQTVIKAARGEIVDRYGRPLATNKVGFNIVFDRAFLPKGEENQIISELIDLMEKSGVDWIDELPISETEPYSFIEGMESEIKTMKSKYLRLNTYATAQNCMDELISKYKITGFDAKKTRQIAGVRYQMALSDFSVYNRYTFAEDIPVSLVATVKELSDLFPGVDISEETMRNYVSGTIAPHIIGTIGPIYAEQYQELKEQGYKMNDIVGKSGVEKSFESILRGTDGIREISQNAKGNVIEDKIAKEPVPGNTVVLTIDKYLQKEVQDILEDHIKNVEVPSKDGDQCAFAGSVVVLDVKTGEVLACATYPSYDINDYRTKYNELVADKKGLPLMNRPLTGGYRPGSTFKTVVAAGALIEGKITQGTREHCGKIWDKYPFKCLSSHGNINVVTALERSCNIFFYETGLKLGIDKINEYANAFGLGVDNGLEIYTENGAISNEARKKLFTTEKWAFGDVAQTAIGQLDTVVTPLQMAAQAMTLANNGTRYETHILKSVQSYNFDKTISETQPVVASEIKDKNGAFEIVREGMLAASNRIADNRKLPYTIAVKTGTPQVNKNITNSAIIGYGPAQSPEIAVAILIEEGNASKTMISRVFQAYEKTKTMQQDYPQDSQTLLP